MEYGDSAKQVLSVEGLVESQLTMFALIVALGQLVS